MAYINGESKEVGCLFCLQLTKDDGPENLILYRGKHAYVILNRYPYTNGHLMVVPYAHEASLEGLNDDARSELMHLTNLALGVLRQVSGAQAFNVGINIGEAAGAGITDHVHVHIVPRWAGDTNFMSSIGETRVLPEALEETYKKLLAGWRELNRNP
jgi:ATP adenylyltransferase